MRRDPDSSKSIAIIKTTKNLSLGTHWNQCAISILLSHFASQHVYIRYYIRHYISISVTWQRPEFANGGRGSTAGGVSMIHSVAGAGSNTAASYRIGETLPIALDGLRADMARHRRWASRLLGRHTDAPLRSSMQMFYSRTALWFALWYFDFIAVDLMVIITFLLPRRRSGGSSLHVRKPLSDSGFATPCLESRSAQSGSLSPSGQPFLYSQKYDGSTSSSRWANRQLSIWKTFSLDCPRDRAVL